MSPRYGPAGAAGDRGPAPGRATVIPGGRRRTTVSGCEPEQALSGRLFSMNAALASLIAVAGTLLGSLITYRFQRLSTDRAEAFRTRREVA